MTERKVKVMVVDDTVMYRMALTRILRNLEGVEVVGTAANGKQALDKIPLLKPDLVTLDIEMPVMDGLETLKCLTRQYPAIAVVMVSSASRDSADRTVRALGLGSVEFIVKPVSPDPGESERKLSGQLVRVIDILRFKMSSRREEPPPGISSSVPARKPSLVRMVLIGSSTGGPNALAEVLPRLPGRFPVPVLIVQHMPKLFTRSLAARLNEQSSVTVEEGEHRGPVLPGHVYIAPGGRHMTVAKDLAGNLLLKMNEDPPQNSCRPSVDVLFRSSASACPPENTLCVILTGMGADGVEGVRFLRNINRGGYCLAQSRETCVVYGMPRSLVESGLQSEVLPLDAIGDRIVEFVLGGRSTRRRPAQRSRTP